MIDAPPPGSHQLRSDARVIRNAPPAWSASTRVATAALDLPVAVAVTLLLAGATGLVPGARAVVLATALTTLSAVVLSLALRVCPRLARRALITLGLLIAVGSGTAAQFAPDLIALID